MPHVMPNHISMKLNNGTVSCVFSIYSLLSLYPIQFRLSLLTCIEHRMYSVLFYDRMLVRLGASGMERWAGDAFFTSVLFIVFAVDDFIEGKTWASIVYYLFARDSAYIAPHSRSVASNVARMKGTHRMRQGLGENHCVCGSHKSNHECRSNSTRCQWNQMSQMTACKLTRAEQYRRKSSEWLRCTWTPRWDNTKIDKEHSSGMAAERRGAAIGNRKNGDKNHATWSK